MIFSLVTAMQKYTKTIYMKIWETELFALNFKTGELEGVITETFLGGETLVEAQQNLNKSNKPVAGGIKFSGFVVAAFMP